MPEVFLPSSLIPTLKSKLDDRYVSDPTIVRRKVAERLQTVYGEYPAFQFPFSNESVTEPKLIFGNIIKPK